MIDLKNELKSKLEISSNNQMIKSDTVENEVIGSKVFLGRIYHALNKKGGQK